MSDKGIGIFGQTADTSNALHGGKLSYFSPSSIK